MSDSQLSPEETIWQQQLDMYRGFLTKDRSRTDQYIHPESTLWDSGHWDMVVGLTGLAGVRESRPAGDDDLVTDIETAEPVITVVGEIAIVRHTAIVRFSDGRDNEELRNTGIWRLFGESWRLVHNHEQKQ